MIFRYASQKDPAEADVPYCTLKSFPANIEHTIQWGREKLANLFELKPAEFMKYWATNGSPERVLATLRAGTFEKSFANTRQVCCFMLLMLFYWGVWCIGIGIGIGIGNW